ALWQMGHHAAALHCYAWHLWVLGRHCHAQVESCTHPLCGLNADNKNPPARRTAPGEKPQKTGSSCLILIIPQKRIKRKPAHLFQQVGGKRPAPLKEDRRTAHTLAIIPLSGGLVKLRPFEGGIFYGDR